MPSFLRLLFMHEPQLPLPLPLPLESTHGCLTAFSTGFLYSTDHVPNEAMEELRETKNVENSRGRLKKRQ